METRDNPHSLLVLGDLNSLPNLQPSLGHQPFFLQTWLAEASPKPPLCEPLWGRRDCICVGLCLTSAGIIIYAAGVGVMVGTKWNRVTLGDPIWADAYNSVLPSSVTQMVRGARRRTKVCV